MVRWKEFDLVYLLPRRLQPVAILIGALLIELTIGTVYSIGNMTPYIASYLRYDMGIPVGMSDMAWMTELVTFSQGLTVLMGGLIHSKVGTSRRAAAIGCLVATAGVFCTYAALTYGSVWLTFVSYGVIFGSGVGLTYGIPLQCGLHWFPRREGLAAALIVAGFGGAPVIFDQIQTHFVNPENLTPNMTDGVSKYFGQPDILHRVPQVYLIMGATFAVMQCAGLVLLADAPTGDCDEDMALLESKPRLYASEATVKEILKSGTFYCVYATVFCLQVSIDYASGYIKAYGQTFIPSDAFLATIGSACAAANILGRFVFGHLVDKTTYQTAMCILIAGVTVGFVTIPIAPLAGRVYYIIWTMAITAMGAGTAPLFPYVIAKALGKRHLARNYGLIYTSICFSAVFTLLVVENLLNVIGFANMFYLAGGMCFMAFLVTAVIHKTDRGHV